MTDYLSKSYLLDGAPVIDVKTPKYGTVKFKLWTASRGTAYFEEFALRGVEYEGYVAFRSEPRAKDPENCPLRKKDGHDVWKCEKTHFDAVSDDYQNSSLGRKDPWTKDGKYQSNPTPAAREEIVNFVKTEAAKIFEDAALVRRAHELEIARMIDAQRAEIDALQEQIVTKTGRLNERIAQYERGAPFCGIPAQNGRSENCTLPIGHKERCDYGRR